MRARDGSVRAGPGQETSPARVGERPGPEKRGVHEHGSAPRLPSAPPHRPTGGTPATAGPRRPGLRRGPLDSVGHRVRLGHRRPGPAAVPTASRDGTCSGRRLPEPRRPFPSRRATASCVAPGRSRSGRGRCRGRVGHRVRFRHRRSHGRRHPPAEPIAPRRAAPPGPGAGVARHRRGGSRSASVGHVRPRPRAAPAGPVPGHRRRSGPPGERRDRGPRVFVGPGHASEDPAPVPTPPPRRPPTRRTGTGRTPAACFGSVPGCCAVRRAGGRAACFGSVPGCSAVRRAGRRAAGFRPLSRRPAHRRQRCPGSRRHAGVTRHALSDAHRAPGRARRTPPGCRAGLAPA